jgi:hypothetical protein
MPTVILYHYRSMGGLLRRLPRRARSWRSDGSRKRSLELDYIRKAPRAHRPGLMSGLALILGSGCLWSNAQINKYVATGLASARRGTAGTC